MNIETIRQNAQANIAFQEKLASEGKDFCPDVIIAQKRIVYVAENIFNKLTEEEKNILKAKALHPNPNYSDMKATKERLEVSWNELKMMARWCIDPERD